MVHSDPFSVPNRISFPLMKEEAHYFSGRRKPTTSVVGGGHMEKCNGPCAGCYYWEEAQKWVGTPFKLGWCSRGKGVDCVAFVLQCVETFYGKHNMRRPLYTKENMLRAQTNLEETVKQILAPFGGKEVNREPFCGDVVFRKIGTNFDMWTAIRLGTYYFYASRTGVNMAQNFKYDIVISFGTLTRKPVS